MVDPVMGTQDADDPTGDTKMARYENVGWLYPKKTFETSLSSDAWEPIAWMAIPPFAMLQRYHLNVTMAAGTQAATTQQMHVATRGIFFSIDPNTDTTADTSIISYVNQYCPPEADEWADTDTDTSAETELPGHEASGSVFKEHVFFEREKALHLGDGTSMISGDNELTFADYYSTRGNPYRKSMGIGISDMKMMVIMCRSDEAAVSSNISEVTFSDYNSAASMTQAFYNMFTGDPEEGNYAMGMTGIGALSGWLTKGYSETDLQQDNSLQVKARLTGVVKVVKPMSTRHISAG